MNDTGELIEWYYRRKEYTDNKKCVQCHLPFHYKPHMDFLGIKAWPSVWDRERDQRLVTWATVRLRLFRNSFYITPLKLSIKSESLGNERDVDHFMYWRKYDIKKNAEYVLDSKEIQHKNTQRNTKCVFISSHKNAGPM